MWTEISASTTFAARHLEMDQSSLNLRRGRTQKGKPACRLSPGVSESGERDMQLGDNCPLVACPSLLTHPVLRTFEILMREDAGGRTNRITRHHCQTTKDRESFGPLGGCNSRRMFRRLVSSTSTAGCEN